MPCYPPRKVNSCRRKIHFCYLADCYRGEQQLSCILIPISYNRFVKLGQFLQEFDRPKSSNDLQGRGVFRGPPQLDVDSPRIGKSGEIAAIPHRSAVSGTTGNLGAGTHFAPPRQKWRRRILLAALSPSSRALRLSPAWRLPDGAFPFRVSRLRFRSSVPSVLHKRHPSQGTSSRR